MPLIENLPVFLLASILLNLTPGQDTIYILGRSISQGRDAGFASVLGISTGVLVHTFAAALGLSAIIATSATLFTAMNLLGAAYLIYLGVKLLIESASPPKINQNLKPESFLAIFRQGLITNVLNPKVAIFFLAFLPQFIPADSPHKFASFLTLGCIFTTTATLWYLSLVWCSSLFSTKLRNNPKTSTYLNQTSGTLFLLLGLKLATSK